MTAEPRFDVRLLSNDGTVKLEVHGDIDMATVDELKSARSRALAQGPRKLLIDLSEVAFVDSSGLKFLIDTLRLSQQEGWELGLCRPPEGAMKVFTVTGAERLLPFVDERGG